MAEDTQAVLTEVREGGPVPQHVLRARLGWATGRFDGAVIEAIASDKLVRRGEMLSLPVAAFAVPTVPPDLDRDEGGEADQEPVMGPDLPLPEEPHPASSGDRRFLVATAWEEHDGTAEEIAEALLREDDRKVLLVAMEDAVIFERAVIARRVP